MTFFYGAFRAPNPTTNIFARMQKYWTKKSFFSASRAISRIFFLSRLVWLYCFHECIDIGWITFSSCRIYCSTYFSRCIVTSGVLVLYYKKIIILFLKNYLCLSFNLTSLDYFQKSHLYFSDSKFWVVKFDNSEVIPYFQDISCTE